MMVTIMFVWKIGGNFPTNLMAVQTGFDRVNVSWTAPPVGTYHVTAHPGGFNVTTSLLSQTITLQQPGVYSISVMSLSQHYPGGTTGPVEVTVRGGGNLHNITVQPLNKGHIQIRSGAQTPSASQLPAPHLAASKKFQ